MIEVAAFIILVIFMFLADLIGKSIAYFVLWSDARRNAKNERLVAEYQNQQKKTL